MGTLENSSFIDFTAYQRATTSDVATAYGLDSSQIHANPDGVTFTVALVLERKTDPEGLLAESWGTRQSTLAAMTEAELWETYGADKETFNSVLKYLDDAGYRVVGGTSSADALVTSAESRTIWVELDAERFASLFGTEMMLAGEDASNYDFLYWNGHLSLPDEIAGAVKGLWFTAGTTPATAANLAGSTSATLDQGWQSIGNGSEAPDSDQHFTPQDIASRIYHFPLDGSTVNTGLIAFVEPGIGSALPAGSQPFQDLLQDYLSKVGTAGTGTVYTKGADDQIYSADAGGERSLDVSIAAAINPNSDIALYNGNGSTFTAYQAAIWLAAEGLPAETVAKVISSSWRDVAQPHPESPFYRAYSELFIDAALRNQTILSALGDNGSGNAVSNGLTSVTNNFASMYGLLVGGTSVSTYTAAQQDATLQTMLHDAQQRDLSTLWHLIAGGLKTLPEDLRHLATFIETVWNEYYLDGHTLTDSYQANWTSSGGVDASRPTPSYQVDFGLTPTTVDTGLTGRGAPDISANAGGNMEYLTTAADMTGLEENGGTSAATPLWASLVVQLNAVFADQGLPSLGYMNDLLYLSAAIAPAAFNDVRLGNNTSSFHYGGSYISDSYDITPTGYGYRAGEGYDLVTGLGTPNGMLLARALTTIAHSQIYFDVPAVLSATLPESADAAVPASLAGSGTSSAWHSEITQSLLFQASTHADAWTVDYGSSSAHFNGSEGAHYAWTAAFAQQSVQADFSSDLVTLFDGYSQGHLFQATVAAGDAVSIEIGDQLAGAYQASLTSPYGFMAFRSEDGDSAVEVARAVAVATTANAADDQDVVVRLRQNGGNEVAVQFYRVDDFAGTIDGIAPGEAGYAEAVASRAYLTVDGHTHIKGAGYGAYHQTEIAGVNANDLIAMLLTTSDHTFYGFAEANEVVDGQHVGHLWSYGLNSWGWEDLYGGGDRDYNDLIVQLDFTSGSGSGWLV